MSIGEREALYDESLYPYGGAEDYPGDISIGERESPPVYYDHLKEEEFVDPLWLRRTRGGKKF